MPPSRSLHQSPLEDVRFIPERPEDRSERIHVRFEGGAFVCAARPIRRRHRNNRPFFERDWPDYLTGAIHEASALPWKIAGDSDL
jgi:succinate dehydrogenase / fumarate reductase flavoprotein subunit